MGGLGSQVANVVSAFATGGPWAGVAAGVGAIAGRLFGGGGDRDQRRQEEQREQERLAREADRAADALARFVDGLHEATRFETMFADLEDNVTDAFLAGIAEYAGEHVAEIAEQNIGTEGLEAVLERWAELIPGFEEFWQKYQEGLERIEEMRQQDIAASELDAEARQLVAQGRDAEAEAMRRQAQEQALLEEAYALGGEALRELWEETLAMEEEAREAARAADEAALATDLHVRALRLWGSDMQASIADIEAAAEAERQRARDAYEAGEIGKETFRQWIDVIDGEMAQSIQALTEQMRESARAAWEAAEAERFRQAQDMQSLEMRMLRAQGRDAEVLQLRQIMEMEQAMHEGRDAQYIQLLQMVQAEEARAEAMRRSQQATEAATQAADRMANVMNAPTGLPLALRRFQAATTGTPGGGGPLTSGNRVSQSTDNSVTIERIEVHPTAGQSGEDILQAIESAIAKRQRRGGTNPVITVVDS